MTVGGKPPLNSQRPLVQSGILYPETDKIDKKKVHTEMINYKQGKAQTVSKCKQN